jgi:hypothetical protein
MTLFDKTAKLCDKDFKQIIGIKRDTFAEMVCELRLAYAKKHKKRGRHTLLSIEDQLLLCLKYLRQYVTQKELAFEFEVGESTVRDIIRWVEDTLVKCGKFSLPGKKELIDDENEIEVILVDVTESPVERPKKNSGNGIPAKRKNTQ